MQVLDHLGDVPDGADETRRQVVRVGRGEADALDPLHLVDELEEGGQIRGGGQVAPVGIDRLAEQGHLAHARGGELPHLRHDGRARVAPLATPGHGHHAEGAPFLAALHHGDEGLELAHGFGSSGDLDEGRLARLQHGGSRGARARHQLTHARHRGRAEHEIDRGRALLDLPLPELGHAAHDADEDVRPLALEMLELPQAREDLVFALLADGASIQEDQIGVLCGLRQLVALIAQQTGDALRVVLVHLTAVGDQVKFWHKRSALTLAFA